MLILIRSYHGNMLNIAISCLELIKISMDCQTLVENLKATTPSQLSESIPGIIDNPGIA